MNLKLSLILTVLMLSFSLAGAQQVGQGDRYVFIISKVNYLKAIDDAVSASKESGLAVDEVRVILCGESVKGFQEENNPIISKALGESRLRVYACGLSLEQMKVDPATLPTKVSIVRNGILEAMILEKQGFKRFDL
jgi:intracellular sulfur oxidation DsrE/DsrF family protein